MFSGMSEAARLPAPILVSTLLSGPEIGNPILARNINQIQGYILCKIENDGRGGKNEFKKDFGRKNLKR